MRTFAAIAAALWLLPGCAVWRALGDPAGSTAQVHAVSLRTDGTSGELQFELVVPATAGAFQEVRWELWLRGRRSASGVVTGGAIPPSDEHAWVSVTAPLAFPAPGGPARGLALAELRGTVTLGRRGERGTWAFADRRVITVAALAE